MRLLRAGVLLAAMAARPAVAGEAPPDPAAGWDHLWMELLIDITVIGVVFAIAALWMMIRYRAKSPDESGRAPRLTRAQAASWALIPAALFMADDFFLSAKGWTLWNIYRRVPENALEVRVTGYQWFWEFDYGEGVTSDRLVVPVGRPVVLRMTAADVIHSFYMPQYRVKEDVMPGRITYLWFLPTDAGRTVTTCTEYCGINHSIMYTDVEAVAEAEFDAWLAGQRKQASAPAADKKV